MKIAIIGASQGVGYNLLTLALEENHQVSALLRNPSKITIENDNLTLIQGDIRDPEAVQAIVKNQDAICICIGIPPTRKPVDVFSIGSKNVLQAMASESYPQKLISVSGIGAGETKGHGGFLYDRILNPLLLKTIYQDKDRQEEIIKKSNLDWLIVRPGFLTDGERTQKYQIIDDLTGIKAGKISRLDVADFILKQLTNPTHFHKTPLITY
ncbi:SDR family oxidoreductase [Cyanobacterium stanieri LEGE 03274]|uniref:SDR family oxidoreductase n=1 Tax=Cyanobacterium stanieri LEGE 03274 TaxID=1828756 RepID=A0ABR9V694_9CHRO|nr:SDR family oxidoreductase [Cyanobacterium stanieri]MBE9222364.1 SDR family oxidoreductase [Cyanobacterium stanieri LEGE 03274]